MTTEIQKHLCKDKILAKIVKGREHRPISTKKNICMRLCASIMSQQLSTKVADVIYKRFLALYGDKEPTSAELLDTPHEVLRGIGLSNAKCQYVKNVAAFAQEHKISDKQLHQMSDEEVLSLLTQIKGVGRWTVEMILMFAMCRPNIFAADDLGIQTAMIRLYGLDNTNKKQFKTDMQAIAEKWAPYKTYACLYLWDYKDDK